MDSKHIYDYILKIQSIAKIGLIFSKDPYAISNYTEINELSLRFLEEFLEVEFDRPNYFERNIYPTPNISARCLIMSEDLKKIILVREVNSGKYSIPGGWCDLYDSAKETAINESNQEAGADIEVVRLVGLLNHTPFKGGECYAPEYIAVFLAKLVGDLHEHEYETDDVQWFDIDNLPPMSKKVSLPEIERMIDAAVNNKTIFD